VKGKENQTIRVALEVDDPDNDDLDFFIRDGPVDAVIEDGMFLWKPDFDVASSSYTSKFSVKLLVSDGALKDELEFTLSVEDMNRAPFIRSESLPGEGLVGTPITFSVDPVDLDLDDMKITWDFGIFEEYEGYSHTRTFSLKGKKQATVTVSDGLGSLKRDFEIVIS